MSKSYSPSQNDTNELKIFDTTSKNFGNSEQKLREAISDHFGYKEYDFEPDGSSIQQQETEQKIQDLWRMIEKSGIEPYRLPKKKKEHSKTSKSHNSSYTPSTVSPSPKSSKGRSRSPSGKPGHSPKQVRRRSSNAKPRTWTEALRELTARGMDKEAECAKLKTCKLCEHSDMGQVFADEAYEDRYIKPLKPTHCD